MVARRTLIKGASLAVLVASTSRIYVRDGLAQQAPNSSGTEPANTCREEKPAPKMRAAEPPLLERHWA